MNEGFLCEATPSFVRVHLNHELTQRVLEECQFCVLEAMRRSGLDSVLYDLTEMQATPVHVLLYQRLLNEHVAHRRIRRAIVAPNVQIAHMARLAFGGDACRIFYGDHEAAELFLRDGSISSGTDWGIRVVEERRLRDRRSTHRQTGGRRRHDQVAH